MNKKIINQLLLNGKSSASEKIWLKSVKFFDKSFIKDHKKVLNRGLVNVTPLLKVKQLKQKKKRLQIKEFPFITNKKNRISSALKFFLNKTKNKKEIKMYKILVTELLAIANNSTKFSNEKQDLYKYAYLKKNIIITDGFNQKMTENKSK